MSSSTIAFSPIAREKTSLMQLSAQQRRDFLISSVVGLFVAPVLANAKPASTFFYDDKIEFVKEESQMYTGGKIDLNSAFVVRQLFRLL